MSSLYLLHKPYRVLSQFRDHEGRSTLADIIDIPDIYPAGRLDYESEGLLLLSDDGQLIHRISHPRHKQPKTYWVQVEGVPGDDALAALRGGIPLNDGMTRPARVQRLKTPDVPERDPPVRQRQNIPTHWLEITLREGRNRQVRRMTAHVDLPTLRLIRVAVGPWRLGDLKPGEWRSETLHAPVSPKQGSSYRAGRVRR